MMPPNWEYVIAAYALSAVVTVGTIGWSWLRMRRAEAQAERIKGRD